MKLADSKTIQAIDKRAVEDFGIAGIQLMENAGRGAAEAVRRELSALSHKKVAIIAGKGNNGGDGFVAARHLKNSNIDVAVFSLSRLDEIKGDAGANAASWRKMGGETLIILNPGDLKKHEGALREASVIVDAIFGTGLKSNIEGLFADVIRLVNSLKKKVVAVDIPSGIDAATGKVLGAAIRADLTVTMAMPKLGLTVFPGKGYTGRLEIIDIGAPRELIEDSAIRWNLITEYTLRAFIRHRGAETHKSSFGHLLILAGSPGMTGAAYMAGMGAMRIGAGLTTIGLPESLHSIMEIKTTEVMTSGLPETADKGLGPVSYGRIKELMKNKTAVVVGPGAGNRRDIFLLIEKIIKDIEVPLLIDADGLNALAENISILKDAKTDVVLTPHPGEMSRLLKITTEEVQADRLDAAGRLSSMTGATVILKGAGSVIACNDGSVFINNTGNPGLATAGTGDVLAGMVGGLLAQGYRPQEAACAGVHIHGLAGDRVKAENGGTGMIATDLLPHIPKILNSFASESND
ncbi:MAG: NAD(P)H-hydrate dehydratase [Deltaproteobacteria bacterium]|nr:NAD(P)H-hydrate dehydratase [Deltaproteobacteria bacterium]